MTKKIEIESTGTLTFHGEVLDKLSSNGSIEVSIKSQSICWFPSDKDHLAIDCDATLTIKSANLTGISITSEEIKILGDVIIKDPLDKEINIFSDGNLTFYHNEVTQSLQLGKSSDVTVHIYCKSISTHQDPNTQNIAIFCDGNMTIEAINCDLDLSKVVIKCSKNLTIRSNRGIWTI